MGKFFSPTISIILCVGVVVYVLLGFLGICLLLGIGGYVWAVREILFGDD